MKMLSCLRALPAPRLNPRRRLRVIPGIDRGRSRSARSTAARAVTPLLLLCLLALVPACSPVEHTTISTFGGRDEGMRLDHAPEPERIKALSAEIRALSPMISPAEAVDCAGLSIRYARLLADTYGVTDPPEFSNLLINMGLKKRGLCFQMADDLQAELFDRHYKTLTFTRGIAHRDVYLREHNCVVVTGPGQTFNEGLVLDPWRNAGNLRWSRVKLDDYPWVPREPSAAAPVVQGKTAGKVKAPPAAEAASPAITVTSGKVNGG